MSNRHPGPVAQHKHRYSKIVFRSYQHVDVLVSSDYVIRNDAVLRATGGLHRKLFGVA